MRLTPTSELHALLRYHSLAELGREFGLSAGYLGDVSRGRRPASDKLIEKLGLEVVYRRKKAPKGENGSNGTHAQQ